MLHTPFVSQSKANGCCCFQDLLLACLLVLICTGEGLQNFTGSSKKGVAVAVWCNPSPCNWNCADPGYLGASWWWNWDWDNHGCDINNPEFVPMIWGRNNVANIPQIPSGTKWLQTFNEPNYAFAGQDNMSPSDAASYWPQFKNTGKLLTSPGVSVCWYGGDSNCKADAWQWLDEFMSLINNDVNAINIHIYTTDTSVIINAVNTACKYGKEVWLTEFNAGTNSADDHVNLIHSLFGQLESISCLTRYAWVESRASDSSTCLDNSNHDQFNLTPVGKAFMNP